MQENMENRRRHMIGVLSTLVGASLWGFSGTCSQFLLANYAISSLFITLARMVGSALIFLVIILARNRSAISEIMRDRASRRQLMLFGVFGLFMSQITYVITIGYTNAGTATVLQSTNIVMIMVITCIAARRAPRAAELVGLVLAFVATVLVATKGDLGSISIPAAGLAWGLLSAVAAAGYSMLPKPLYPKWGSFTVVGLGMAVGGVVAAALWGLAFAFPSIDAVASAGIPMGTALVPALDAWGVGVLAVIIVFGTFGAFYLFLNGISMVGPVQGSQLGAIEPVSATVCSALIMGTTFLAADWVGLVLMVATIIIVAAGSGKTEIQS